MASTQVLVLRLLLAATVILLLGKVIMIDFQVGSGGPDAGQSGHRPPRRTRPSLQPGAVQTSATPPPSSAGAGGTGLGSLALPRTEPSTGAAPSAHEPAVVPSPAEAPAAPEPVAAPAPAVNPFTSPKSSADVWSAPAEVAPPEQPPSAKEPVTTHDAGSAAAAPGTETAAVGDPGAGATAEKHIIPIAEDLEWHKRNTHCWEHFDLGFLELWNQRKETFCTPTGRDGTQLQCRETIDKHLPPPTAPHTFCEVTNLGFDFSKLRPAKCQKHRPGYNCKGEPYFYAYHKGALLGACNRVERSFHLSRFPRDHLRDIFDSWQSVGSSLELPGKVYDAPITLFITRERKEHANFFHAMTDFVNAYESLHMLGFIDARREGHREGMDRVSVVLLDEQPKGPFDMVYDYVFSPKYPVKRVHHFLKEDRSVTFKHAVFVHPGYTNFLFVQLFEKGSCEKNLQLLQSFREFFLEGFKIETPFKQPGDPIKVTFISRKPYMKFVEHKFMGRQVTNEPELMRAMQSYSDVEATLVDFAQMTFQEQLHLMVETDILVGMHGAALTHALFLPPWGGVLEMWPKTRDMWRCFEHWTQLSGHAYRRHENSNPNNFHADRNGDYTKIDVLPFKRHFNELVEHVKSKRQQLHDLAQGR